MYYFPPPQLKLSWPFLALAIMSHSVSFHSFRAFLLVKMNSMVKQNNDELQHVTYLFDTMYYIFFGAGAILLDLTANKYSFLLLIMLLSIAAQLMFFISQIAYSAQIAYVLVAVMAGTIKIGLVAYGAAEYPSNKCTDICRYFAITYMAEIIGHLVALRFVPMDMILQDACGRLSCPSYVMVKSLMFGIISWITFSLSYRDCLKELKNPIFTELSKLGRVLVVFLPFLIVWINYGDGIWRWMKQATYMNCQFLFYKLSAHDMLMMDLIAVILCGLLYMLVMYSKFIVTKPVLTIGFGGFLMTAGMILCSYLFGTLKEYYDLKLPNITSIYISASCAGDGTPGQLVNPDLRIDLNSTSIYFNHTELQHFYWMLDGNRSCYQVTMTTTIRPGYAKSYTMNVCLKEKTAYAFNLRCMYIIHTNEFVYSFEPYTFDASRDFYGRPRICIVMPEFSNIWNYHVKLQAVNNPGVRYFVMTSERFRCLIIKEGSYDIIVNFKTTQRNVNFQYGGVYIMEASTKGQVIVKAQAPLIVPIWYLLIIITIVAFGKNCIIITGLYVVYSQTPINIKAIAIGCWWLFNSSGMYIFTISNSKYTNPPRTTFMFTGILIGLMTVLFLCLSICYAQWDFTCDAAIETTSITYPLPAENEEEDELSQSRSRSSTQLKQLTPSSDSIIINKSVVTVEYRHRQQTDDENSNEF